MKYLKTYERRKREHPEFKKFSEKLSKFFEDIGSKYYVKFAEESAGNYSSIKIFESIENYNSTMNNGATVLLLFVDVNNGIKTYGYPAHSYHSYILDYILDLCQKYEIEDAYYYSYDIFNIEPNKDEYEMWSSVKKYNL